MPEAKLRLVDLCAGTGGFSLADKRHFTPVWANDISPDSKVIFEANHPDVPFDCRALNDVPLAQLPQPGSVDIVCGGFPCQPYSIAGRQRGLLDARSDVFEHILTVVRYMQPRWLVCENVVNLVRIDKGAVFRHLQARAAEMLPGWQFRWTIYNTAKHTGIPQNRERVYMVWFRDEQDARRFKFKQPEPEVKHVSSVLQPCASVPDTYYYDQKPGNVAASMRENVVLPVHTTGTVYQRRPDLSVRQNKSGLIPALTANMGQGCYSGPVIRDTRGVRKFTPSECFAAQGFLKNFLTGGLCDTTLYRLSGNAITVPVASLVLKSVWAARAKTA